MCGDLDGTEVSGFGHARERGGGVNEKEIARANTGHSSTDRRRTWRRRQGSLEKTSGRVRYACPDGSLSPPSSAGLAWPCPRFALCPLGAPFTCTCWLASREEKVVE